MDPLKRRLSKPPINPSRVLLREFARQAGEVGHDTSFKVLDAGAGSQPYADLFAHVTYESADHTKKTKPTYVCDLAELPMGDGTYDLVFCSQALEHVPDPIRVLREMHRVLKPGGQAWLTAPLIYPEHDIPHDYYRYTRYAWRYMAKESGFEVAELKALEGYLGTLVVPAPHGAQAPAARVPVVAAGAAAPVPQARPSRARAARRRQEGHVEELQRQAGEIGRLTRARARVR